MKRRSSAIFQAQPSLFGSPFRINTSQAALFLTAIDLNLPLGQVNVKRAVHPKIAPLLAHFANEINSGFIQCLVERMLTTQEGVTLPTGKNNVC